MNKIYIVCLSFLISIALAFISINLSAEEASKSYVTNIHSGEVVQSSSRVNSLNPFKNNNNLNQNKGVIVEFYEPSLAEQKESLKHIQSFKVKSLKEAHSKIINEQLNFVKELNEKVEARGVNINRSKISSINSSFHFTQTLNAISFSDISEDEMHQILSNNPDLASNIKRVEPNLTFNAYLDTSVPITKADILWKEYLGDKGFSLDGRGIKIGILDTGVNYKHQDLGGCFGENCKVLGGWDFINDDSDPIDDNGHGTHVASIAAGLGEYSQDDGSIKNFYGVAPGAKIYAIKVLDSSGVGSSETVIKGIEYCTDPNGDGDYADKLDVCNLSLGAPGDPDDLVSKAVDAAVDLGVVIVTSAGNEGDKINAIGSPGAARKAITVAASCRENSENYYCKDGPIANFSSRGPILSYPEIVKPDISAPGVEICAALNEDDRNLTKCGEKHIISSGTSMSSPHVAGAVALLKQAHPDISAIDIKNTLLASASDLGVSVDAQGRGLVNVESALKLLGSPNSFLRVNNAPILINIAPDNTLSSFQKELSLKNTSNSVLNVAPQFNSAFKAYTAKFYEENFSLNPGETKNINILFNYDIFELPKKNSYTGILTFKTNLGEMSLNVQTIIDDYITLSTKKIDFGVLKGDQNLVDSSIKLEIHNKLNDYSTTFDVNFKCCDTGGISYSEFITSDYLKTIEVEGGKTAILNLNIKIEDSDKLPNESYQGLLTLTSKKETYELPVLFFKGFGLKLIFPESDLISNGYLESIIVYNKNDIFSSVPDDSSIREHLIFFKEQGEWEVYARWYSLVGFKYHYLNVFKHNVKIEDAISTVVIDPRESDKKVDLIFKDHPKFTEEKKLRTSITSYSLFDKNFGAIVDFHRLINSYSSPDITFYTNDLSDNIIVSGVSLETYSNKIANIYQFYTKGNNKNSLTIKSGDFFNYYLSAPFDLTSTEPLSLFFNICSPYNPNFRNSYDCGLFNLSLKLNPNEYGLLNIALNENFDIENAEMYNLTPWSIEAKLQGDLSDYKITTPYFFATENNLYSWHKNSTSYSANEWLRSVPRELLFKENEIKRYNLKQIAIGAAPFFDSGQFYNIGGDIDYDGYRKNLKQPVFSYGRLFTHSQYTYEYSEFDFPVTYKTFVDGENTISGSDHFQRIYFTDKESINGFDFEVQSSAKSFLAGELVNAKTISKFNTKNSSDKIVYDANPPVLTLVEISATNFLQNVIDSSLENEIVFGVDPVAGFKGLAETESLIPFLLLDDSLSSVSLLYSEDNINWISVEIESISEGLFKTKIPASKNTKKHYFNIKAKDLALNELSTFFEVPEGKALIFDADFNGKPDVDYGDLECLDKKDNDGDSLIDLDDPGCTSNIDNNESDGTTECQDDIDNDEDGYIDLQDNDCYSITDPKEGEKRVPPIIPQSLSRKEVREMLRELLASYKTFFKEFAFSNINVIFSDVEDVFYVINAHYNNSKLELLKKLFFKKALVYDNLNSLRRKRLLAKQLLFKSKKGNASKTKIRKIKNRIKKITNKQKRIRKNITRRKRKIGKLILKSTSNI